MEAPHRKDKRAWAQAIDVAKKWAELNAWVSHCSAGPVNEIMEEQLYAACEKLHAHAKGLGLL